MSEKSSKKTVLSPGMKSALMAVKSSWPDED